MSNRTGLIVLAFLAIALSISIYLNRPDNPKLPSKEERRAMHEKWMAESRQRAKLAEQKQKEDQQRESDRRHERLLTFDAAVRQQVERSKRERWVELPSSVQRVYVDATGRPWFTMYVDNLGISSEDTKRSVEDVFAGKALCIVQGEILLVDSRGTLWLQLGNVVAGYDGKQWQYVNPSGETVPAQIPRIRGDFVNWAAEDKSGNLWFFSTLPAEQENKSTGRFLQRTPTGQWLTHPITQATTSDLESLVRDCQTVSHEHGRLLLYRKFSFAYFDGSAWKVSLDLEKQLGRSLYGGAPLANGSIALIDNNSVLWFHWPDPALIDNASISKLIADLNAEDATTRDRAVASLARHGPAIRPLLEKAGSLPDCPPETRLHLENLVSFLDKKPEQQRRELKNAGTNLPHRELVPGIEYGELEIVAWHAGTAVLEASECRQIQTGRSVRDQYLRINGDGEVQQFLLAGPAWEEHFHFREANDRQADRLGNIWLAGGCRLGQNGQVSDLLPGMFRFKEVVGPDTQSRTFIDNRYILNESIPPVPPALPEKLVASPESRFHIEGNTLWMMNRNVWPGTLSLVDDAGTAKPINCPWKEASPYQLIPFSPGALVTLCRIDEPDTYAFFDGARWDQSGDLHQLVKRNADFIASHTSKYLVGSSRSYVRIGGTPDRLWLCGANIDYSGGLGIEKEATIELYDGQRWHDVGKKLKLTTTNNLKMALVDNGRAMLLVQLDDSKTRNMVHLVTLEAGDLKISTIRETARPQRYQKAEAICLPDQTWIQGLNDNGKVAVLRDGVLTDMPAPSSIMLADSLGRGWMSKDGVLCVYDRGAWGEIPIENAAEPWVMGEDLVLCHTMILG